MSKADKPMPRLSESLKGPRSPEHCQSCGKQWDLERYQEHADDDEPEPIIVVLCDECSERLIDKHPRLYRDLELFEVWPGTEGFCIDCAHRSGVECCHPDLKANGGPGLKIKGSGSTGRLYMCGGKGGSSAETFSAGRKECMGRMANEGPTPRILAYIGGVNHP